MKILAKVIFFFVFILSISLNFFLYLLLNSKSDNTLSIELQNYHPTTIFKSLPENLRVIESSRFYFQDDRYSIFSAYRDLDAKHSSIWLFDNEYKTYYKMVESYNHTIYSTPKLSPDKSKILFVQIYPFAIFVTDLQNFSTEVVVKETDKNSEIAPSLYKDFYLNVSWLNNNEILFEDNQNLDEVIKKINIVNKKIDVYKIIKADISKKEVFINVPHFSQRDKLWSEDKLGTCDKHTIKTAGCAITSVAMILSYNKLENINPKTLNDVLIKENNQGYFNGCDVKWYVPIQLSDNLKLKWVYFNEFNLDRVHKELNKGNPVIIGFNKVPFTNLQHWVVIIGYKNGQYIINDPWDDRQGSKTLNDFGDKFDHMIVYENVENV